MSRPRKKHNLLQGYKVVIRQHVVDRYMERAGVSEHEARKTLEAKFRNSRISRFKKDGAEERREIQGTLNKRLTFIAYKTGNTFHVVTCYLQGKRNEWWKNEGVVEVKEQKINEEEITEDIEKLFREA